jgi:hypothetical protein
MDSSMDGKDHGHGAHGLDGLGAAGEQEPPRAGTRASLVVG